MSAVELEQLRTNPVAAIQASFVVCLECGRKVPGAFWRHLKHAHEGMTVRQYRLSPALSAAVPRYSSGTALVPRSTSHKMRERALRPARRKAFAAIQYPAELLAEAAEAARTVTGRRRFSQEFRQRKRRALTGITRPDQQKVQNAPLARLRLEGRTAKEIAQFCGFVGHAGVQRRLVAMGFPVEACVFEHGIPLTGTWVDTLCDDFGLDKSRLAKLASIPLPTLLHAGAQNNRDRSLSLKLGGKLQAWRQAIIGRWCYTPDRQWRVREFLQSEVRLLPELHSHLRDAISKVRERHRSLSPNSVADSTMNWLCSKAKADFGLRALRNLWAQFENLLEGMPESKRKRIRPNELAVELLAASFGATSNRINQVLKGNVQPYDVRSIRALVLAHSAFANRRTGRPKGIQADTRVLIRLAAVCCVLGKTKWGHGKELYPNLEPQAAYSAVKQLHRRHGPEIQTEMSLFTTQTAEAYLNNHRRTRSGTILPP